METEDYWERYRTPAQIRAKGALTNLGDGVPIRAHGIDTWPSPSSRLLPGKRAQGAGASASGE